MKQLTKEEAIEFYNKGEWRNWSAKKIVEFQLYQEMLCVDFAIFLESLSQALGRRVYTHELGDKEKLCLELEKKIPVPTEDEVIDKLFKMEKGIKMKIKVTPRELKLLNEVIHNNLNPYQVDLDEDGDCYYIYCTPEGLQELYDNFKKQNLLLENKLLDWGAKILRR